MAEPPLIDIRNATIWRGSTRVFANLNLRIEQHERVAILGPNGSGKTTLLKAMNRELYPVSSDDSHLRILGRDRWNVWQLRKRIGFISDDLNRRYTPTATALDVVLSGFHASIGVHGSLAARVRPEQRDAARGVLQELGIAHLEARMLKHMSTGQQRRALLGRALVHRPQALVLDEPTAGLDLAASFEYLDRIRGLAANGNTIVLVTHDPMEIPPEVDRIVLLVEGRVAADGEKADVLTGANLTAVYRTPINVTEVDSFYLAYPGD